jgi:hypothetical protein
MDRSKVIAMIVSTSKQTKNIYKSNTMFRCVYGGRAIRRQCRSHRQGTGRFRMSIRMTCCTAHFLSIFMASGDHGRLTYNYNQLVEIRIQLVVPVDAAVVFLAIEHGRKQAWREVAAAAEKSLGPHARQDDVAPVIELST